MSGQKARSRPRDEKGSVWIAPETAGKLKEFVDRFNGRWSQMAILSEVVERFSKMPDPAKFAMIGWVPSGMEPTFASILREIADQLERQTRNGPMVDHHLMSGEQKKPAETPAQLPAADLLKKPVKKP